jgi:hypothetical protein
MKKFMHNGSCWWLVVGDNEKVVKCVKEGGSLFINNNGGYHYGTLSDELTKECEDYPMEYNEYTWGDLDERTQFEALVSIRDKKIANKHVADFWFNLPHAIKRDLEKIK